MRTFKDTAGRTWTIQINVNAVKACRALAGVDLVGLFDPKLDGLSELLADPVRLVDTLYVLCKAEADKASVSDEDFGRAMGGDALDHASRAFLDELVDFFPDPRRRETIKKILTASRALQERMMEETEKEVDAIDVDSIVRKLIGSSGDSPGSSGSTPDPSPSGNST